MDTKTLIFIVFLTAIVLDIAFLWGWRRYLKNRGGNGEDKSIRKFLREKISLVVDRLKLQLLSNFSLRLRPSITAVVLLLQGLILLFFTRSVDKSLIPVDLHWIISLLSWIALLSLTLGIIKFFSNQKSFDPNFRLTKIGDWLSVKPFQVLCLGFAVVFTVLTAVLAAEHRHMLVSPLIAIVSWFLAIVNIFLGGLIQIPRKIFPQWQTIIWIIVLTSFGWILRAVDTTHIPVSLTGDEGSVGLSALSILEGNKSNIFSSDWHGFPSLYFFIQALSVSIFGPTVPALRLTSALVGAMTVGGTYLLGRAMFGHRSGLAAAAFLAAFHYHIHFSRIGLNNVWDGLGYVVTLGSFWFARQTGRRSFYIISGVSLGLTQYFYASSRMLVFIILGLVFFDALFYRKQFKQRLPDLVLVFLATIVIILPLFWFFVRHLDEFWGPLRAQSIFGPWMSNEINSTGQTAWAIFFRQVWLGLSAFTFTPSQAWYRSGVPILRLIPSIFWWIGLLALSYRLWDRRFHLIILWILCIGLIGAFSVNTPAAQRYVAVAPVCALTVGYGFIVCVTWVTKIYPRWSRQIGWIAVLMLILIGADDIRFYFLEYIPNSHYRGKYDFEGYGSITAMRLAAYLQGFSSDWEVQYFGPPRLSYTTIPSLPYLANWIKGVDVIHPWGSYNNPKPSKPNRIFVFLPGHEQDLAAAQIALPGGLLITETDDKGYVLYDLYQYPAEPGRTQIPRWNLRSNEGLSQPTLVWSALFFLGVGTGLYLIHKWRPDFSVLEDDKIDSVVSAQLDIPTNVLSKESRKDHSDLLLKQTIDSPTSFASRSEDIPKNIVITSQVIPYKMDIGDAPSDIARINITADIPKGSGIQITIEHSRGNKIKINHHTMNLTSTGVLPPGSTWRNDISDLFSNLIERLRKILISLRTESKTLEIALFIIAIGVYFSIRLFRLLEFPIYFFSDEAIQTVLAADLVRDGFHDPDRIFLPTYFLNSSFYNLSLSVYAQVIPYLVLGKSVLVTRMTSVLFTLIAVLSVGFILKDIFNVRYWWSGVLLLSVAPCWFLHSRTAFETVMFVSFYAGFLYSYLLYLYRSPRYIYIALIMAALAFYSYSPGQAVVGITSIILFVTDFRYHFQNRDKIFGVLLFILILAFPYLRFLYFHSDAQIDHLRSLDSYWLYPIPVTEKIVRFGKEYFYGLNFNYWFFPNNHDIQRHIMKGYGHLSWWTLPFFVIGLILGLRKSFSSPAHRLLIIAMLCAPIGSAMVGIGITRVLVFVIPATLITAIGLSEFLNWVEYPRLVQKYLFKRDDVIPWIRIRIPSKILQVGLLVVLVMANYLMFSDTLTNSPTWFTNYGLYGMQYGAEQVFGEFVPQYLQKDSDVTIFISSIWANGTNVFAQFFLTPEERSRIMMGSIKSYLFEKRQLESNTVFVITMDEFRAVEESKVLSIQKKERVIQYPDGTPGFVVARLSYKENADAIFAAEEEARRKLTEESIQLYGQRVLIRYSHIDPGQISKIFDGDFYTLVRGAESNPFIIEIEFPKSTEVKGIEAGFGSMDFSLSVYLYEENKNQPKKFVQAFRNQFPDPQVKMVFHGGPYLVTKMRVEILGLKFGDKAKIHIRELGLVQ